MNNIKRNNGYVMPRNQKTKYSKHESSDCTVMIIWRSLKANE